MLSSKTLFAVRSNIQQFFLSNDLVTFITFTQPGVGADGLPHVPWTKDEAESRLKPFRDLCRRRRASLIVVWELQARGCWHPHCLVNKYFHVKDLRAFMVERGWGVQMRAEVLSKKRTIVRGDYGYESRDFTPGLNRVVRYLTKYLTKSSRYLDSSPLPSSTVKKKLCGSALLSSRSTTMFKWLPSEKAGAYLYSHGRSLFFQLYERSPSFRDIALVIRLGVEDTGWADVDPLWEFGFR